MVLRTKRTCRLQTVQSTTGTVAALAGLLAALPVSLTFTVIAWLRSQAAPRPVEPAAVRRTVMISGGKMTKALALARAFHRAGHRTILVESAKYRMSGHRYSRAVDRFHPVPEPHSPDYVEALTRIARDEDVDVYVPVCSPASSYHDARAKPELSRHCEVLHFDLDTVRRLDDKFEFSRTAESLGLSVPESYRITDPQQVIDFDFGTRERRFILKSIPYDPVRRLDLTRLPCDTPAETAAFVRSLPISEDNPWIMQEYIAGQEYCTHSTVRDGEVTLHCCCTSSAFQVNYEMVDRPDIEAWIRRFVGALELTGQVSFDFIEAADGRIYAIECNPRTHSAITMFYDHPGVAEAYLSSGRPTIAPLSTSRPTHWLYHEVWRLLTDPRHGVRRLRSMLRGKDAIFDHTDPLPFLLVHHAQIPWLLLQNLRHRTGWIRIDFNIGKLVEPAGD